MKRMGTFLGLVLALEVLAGGGEPAWAQKVTPVTTLISTASTGDSTALDVEFYNSVSITITMTSTGTVQFRVSGNGSTYSDLSCFSTDDTSGTPVTSATASGTYQCNVAAMQKVKITVSANGGTITVQAQASIAVAKLKGGGGGGGGGAPTTAGYWVDQANGGLSAERNLGGLTTGLVLNTVTAGVGVPSAYAGTTCANQVLRLLSATGAGTCVTITSAYVDTSIWTGTVSSGLLKASSQGVLAQAVSGTDYVVPAGNVATATALAANGANCSAGSFPLGVDASGASETCTALPTTITGTASEITASASTGAVTLSLPSSIDMSGKSLKLPSSTTLPATCAVGQIYMDTDATSGQRIYACESTNTWVLQGDGGGGGSGYATVADEATPLTQRSTINFTGAGVTCVDNAGSARTDCTISGGGTPSAVAPQVTTVNAGNAPYTALTTDWSIRCDTTAAGRTINLPAATNKLMLMIKNIGANACTIARNGTDTIDGATSLVLQAQYVGVMLVSNGSNGWDIQ